MTTPDPAHDPQPDRPAPGPSSRWLYVALAIVVAAAVVATATALRARLTPPALAGAVLNPPVQAYDFRLPDQDGRFVSLGDLRGRVVVLTFLYTRCPDVCPLIADALHRAYQTLGATAPRAAFLAVSVDPDGDTPDAIRAFLTAHHVEHQLSYLHGTFAQLRPVWSHYYVGSSASEVNPQAPAASAPTAAEIDHTAIVYVIDPSGKIKVFLPGNLDPNDLVADIRALAGR